MWMLKNVSEYISKKAEDMFSSTEGQSSQSPPPPPPPKVLDKPWRKIDWGKKQESLQYVNNYKPFNKEQQLRILLHGQCGAGKSSFINSVQSVLRGRMCRQALADNTSGDSFTKKYKTYRIHKDRPDIFYPFIFNDLMGLSKHKGALVDDIKLSLQGHVKDNCRFNTESRLPEDDALYNIAPNDNDKVHVLVYVVDANTLSTMSDEVQKKFKDIREEASHLDIPQIAILTKVDAACPEVKKDLKNIYRSTYLKEMMEQFSVDVGIPMDSIFLVKNYHEEIDLNDDIDSLILSALKHILYSGEDFVNRKLETM
ncbi:interferon-induced protein 44-like [Betta splendens]|uniref:Interferon-induced protein 44-like n=1 Tax=Betta splendens TaxID=158456 RepID=A0A9W2XF84_BETSP|nr:interferon-induced protein 44-like [Betta splendens]